MIHLRKPKGRGGIGGGGEKRSFKPLKRSKLRHRSAKQRRRTIAWGEKFMIYKANQVKNYGTVFCEAGRAGVGPKCWGEIEPDHVIPRGRHPENVDGYWNIQGLCTGHHRWKTGTPGMGDKDFRSHRTKTELKQMDVESDG